MRRAALCLVIVPTILLAFQACAVVTSVYPVSQRGEEPCDSRLHGVWSTHDSGETIYAHVGPGPGEILDVVVVIHKDNGNGVEILEFEGFTTKGSTRQYLNLRAIEEGRAKEDYIVVGYRLEGDELSLQIPDTRAVVERIENGTITGAVTRNSGGDPERVLLTAPSKTLKSFLEEGSASELFPREHHFRKVEGE